MNLVKSKAKAMLEGILRRLSASPADQNILQDAGLTYPLFRLEAGMPGLFIEHIQSPDFVFAESRALCQYIGGGREMELMFTPTSGSPQVCAKLTLSMKDGVANSYEFPELTERANYRQVTSLPQYMAIKKVLHSAALQPGIQSNLRGSSRQGMPVWGVTALCGLVFLSAILLFSGTGAPSAPGKPLAAIKAPAGDVSASATLAPAGDQLNESEKRVLAKAVADSGIEWRSGGKPFVVFSDPNCPACRQLEEQLASIDKSLTPVIVPVAFKKSSEEVVAGVLCAKDVAAAWKLAASGQVAPPPAPGCPKGVEQTTANNAAFVALRFDRTPTIVASNGKVAVGAKDFEGLLRWIKLNSIE